MNQAPSYYLGCPVWACRDWIGTVFESSVDSSALLSKYSQLFKTVEANATFYALPSFATLEKWMAETSDGFQFSPKFPKSITHERRLTSATEETSQFLRVLETLQHGERLGPSFIQLPPSFNANRFETLESYLRSLPKAFRYALEPRHITWFDQGENEAKLDDLLEELNMDKVIFDSRPLFSAEASDDHEASAQSRKPQTPVRKASLGSHPFLRLVGRNDVHANEPWIKEWAPIINKWILEGKRPFIFTHTPDEGNAPFLARRLHEQIRKLNPLLAEFPPFASDSGATAKQQEQLDLF